MLILWPENVGHITRGPRKSIIYSGTVMFTYIPYICKCSVLQWKWENVLHYTNCSIQKKIHCQLTHPHTHKSEC